MQDKNVKKKKDQKPVRDRVVDKDTLNLAAQIVKKDKKKFTPEQVIELKKAWAKLKLLEARHLKSVAIIEREMQKKLGIKDVEFYWVDGDYYGIGNVSKTMEMIASYVLEKK